jgi:hypothetical protein
VPEPVAPAAPDREEPDMAEPVIDAMAELAVFRAVVVLAGAEGVGDDDGVVVET